MPIQPLTIAMLSIHSSPIGVLGTRDTGGMSVYVRELAREMGCIGHQVDIFTRRRQKNDPVVTAISPHVRLITLDIPHRGPLAKGDLFSHTDDYRAAIENFCRDQGCTYDLIHSHYWLSGQVGRLLGSHWQRPHVITFHTLGVLKDNTGVGADEPTRRLMVEKELVQACDGLLVPCEGEKSNLMHYYDAVAATIAMVPGGVDRKRFRPMQKTMARQRLGLDPRGLVLLTIGRLTPQKGQARIINALACFGEYARPQLIVVGGSGNDDPEQQHLQNVALEAGVQKQVHFVGSVPHRDLPTYYAAADVFVLASHYESFGLVGLEALACGRPVVATPVGIMNDLARMHSPGVVVTDGSPEGLAAGIAAAVVKATDWDPHLIHNTGREFTWVNAALAALKAYGSAIQAHARSRGAHGCVAGNIDATMNQWQPP
jgi:D-inositol-3-phosphate glycosyltransferase